MTVALVCFACHATCEVLCTWDNPYLFGVVMKYERVHYVWNTACDDCDR